MDIQLVPSVSIESWKNLGQIIDANSDEKRKTEEAKFVCSPVRWNWKCAPFQQSRSPTASSDSEGMILRHHTRTEVNAWMPDDVPW